MLENLLGLNACMKAIESKQVATESSNDLRNTEVIKTMKSFDKKFKRLDEKVDKETEEIRTEISSLSDTQSKDKVEQNEKLNDTSNN